MRETKARESIAPDQELAVDDFSNLSDIVATSYNEHPSAVALGFFASLVRSAFIA
jgi:hypothetical protein